MTGHLRHILVRDVMQVEVTSPVLDLLAEPQRPRYEMVEVILCTMCGMPPVVRPEGMPDYSQVDRLWRKD